MSVTFNNGTSSAQALIALWNSTNALGMGALHSHNSPSVDEAEAELTRCGGYVDYFNGKPIKTDFNAFPKLSCGGYDRDAGRGMMQKVADGMAPHIGATPKLSEGEAKEVIEEANSGITITTGLPTVSSGYISAKQFCNWLDKNRPVNCHPQGVQMYTMLLMYDLDKGVSGFDGSPIPKVDVSDMETVIAHIIAKAEENGDRKGGSSDDGCSCCH